MPITWHEKVSETLKISAYHPFLTQHIPPELLVFFFLRKMREEMNNFNHKILSTLLIDSYTIHIQFFWSVSYLFCYIRFKMFKTKSYSHSKNSLINSSTNFFITILKKLFIYDKTLFLLIYLKMQMIATPKEKQMTKLPAKEMEIVGQWTKSDLKKK